MKTVITVKDKTDDGLFDVDVEIDGWLLLQGFMVVLPEGKVYLPGGVRIGEPIILRGLENAIRDEVRKVAPSFVS